MENVFFFVRIVAQVLEHSQANCKTSVCVCVWGGGGGGRSWATIAQLCMKCISVVVCGFMY